MFILSLLLFSLNANANANPCTYRLNQVAVHVGDRNVQFGDYLNQQLTGKAYLQAAPDEVPALSVEVIFKTYDADHFQHAYATVMMTDLSSGSALSKDADTRCYTQNCAATDAAKVLKASIVSFEKVLPSCKAD